jgi:Carboxypeptidase regulatory-like domain
MLTMAWACRRTPAGPTPAAGAKAAGAPTVTAVRVAGSSRVAPGETAYYTATATYSDGSSKDVTAIVSWNPPGDRTWFPIYFTSAGVALGANRGETDISAGLDGKFGSLHVLVLESGTFKLSGVVAESSGRLVSNVAIDVVAGRGTGLRATTDSQGRYALYGVVGQIQLRVSAEGFTPQTHDLVVATDETATPFALEPKDPPVDISGTWTMTLTPSPRCAAALSDLARGRTYQIQFVQQGTGLKLAITSPTLKVFNAGENYGTVFGSQVQFTFIGDTDYGDWSSTDLIDQLSPTQSLGFDGTVRGAVVGSELRASLSGDIVYWEVPNPSFGPQLFCRATDHAVMLRR